MTDQEKNTTKLVGKIAALSLLSIIALLPTIGVWIAAAAGVIGSIFGVVSIFNLLFEAYWIYGVYEYLFPKADDKSDVKSE